MDLLGRWKFLGKKWYDFRELDNNRMEVLFQKYLLSQQKEYLFEIQIDNFLYAVDFANMRQTNLQTGRGRDIYRETSSSNFKKDSANEEKPNPKQKEDPKENDKFSAFVSNNPSSPQQKTKPIEKKEDDFSEGSHFKPIKSSTSSKIQERLKSRELKESSEEKPKVKTTKIETNEDLSKGPNFKPIYPAENSKVKVEEERKSNVGLKESSKEKPREKTQKVEEPTDMEATSFVLFDGSGRKSNAQTTIAVKANRNHQDDDEDEDEEDDFHQNIIWEIKFISKELWLPFDRNACKALEASYQKIQKGEKLVKNVDVNFRGINFHINVVKMNHDYNDLGYKKQNVRRRELKPFNKKIDVKKQVVKQKAIFGDLSPPFNKYYCQQITNKILLERYENAKKTQEKSSEKLLFHGTKRVYLERILKEGFVLPSSNDGMLGDKIYMCEDMEKAMQYCDPKDVIIIVARCLMNKKDPVEYQNEKYKEYGFSKEETLYPQYVLYSKLDDE